MNKLMLKMSGIALVGLLAACGNQPQNNSGLTQSDAKGLSEAAVGDLKLTSSLMADASTAALSTSASVDSLEVNALAWGLPRRLIMVLKAFEVYIPAAATGTCTISKSGDQTDADNDGVPVNATYTFDCTATGPADGTYSNKGSITLKDTNDAQAESGFSLSFDAFKTRISPDASKSVERTLQGSYSLDKQDATLYKIGKNYTHSVVIANGNNTYNGSLSFNVNKTYAPEDPAAPWSKGTITIDKAAPGTATWTRNNTRNLIWYTDPTLHYNRADCQNPGRILNFDSGAKEYVYTNPAGEKSTLRIEFSACGTFSVTFNGQPVQ